MSELQESFEFLQDASFGIIPIFLSGRSNFENPLFLLVQHHAGHWAFPKGHPHPEETPLVAACREFTEETGIQEYQLMEGISFSERYKFIKKNRSIEKTVTYFLAIVNSLEVQPQIEEIQNFAWKPFAEAQNLITYEANREVLAQVWAYLQTLPEVPLSSQ